jgi:hypothetical protein
MLRVQLNGRDVLPMPYSASYNYTSVPAPAGASASSSTVAYREGEGGGGVVEEGEGGVMPPPVEGVLVVDESEALGPFLGLCQMLGTVSQPGRAIPLSYEEYLQGCTLYCVPINNHGNSTTPGGRPALTAGALDIEVFTSFISITNLISHFVWIED